jgi:hypothetical protein
VSTVVMGMTRPWTPIPDWEMSWPLLLTMLPLSVIAPQSPTGEPPAGFQ